MRGVKKQYIGVHDKSYDEDDTPELNNTIEEEYAPSRSDNY